MNRSHILLVLLLLGGSSVSGAAQMGSEVPATTVQSEPNSTQENVAPQGQVQAGLQAVKQWGNDHPRTMTALKVLAGWVAFEVVGSLYVHFVWPSAIREAQKVRIQGFKDIASNIAEFSVPEHKNECISFLGQGLNNIIGFEKTRFFIPKFFYAIKNLIWNFQFNKNWGYCIRTASDENLTKFFLTLFNCSTEDKKRILTSPPVETSAVIFKLLPK